MQSIFPSIKKFGMAALLPHKELTVELRNDILTVLADGQSTASGYRDKVLKAEDPASVALKYNDIIAMKRVERSSLVKGMDVVYIYHDTIDEASHTSDTAVFAACGKAISDFRLTSPLRWMSLISLVKYRRRMERWSDLQRMKAPVKK